MASEKQPDEQAPSPNPPRPQTSSDLHAAYHPGVDAQNLSPRRAEPRKRSARSDTEIYRDSFLSPVLVRRRSSRTNTFKTVDDCDDFDTYGALPGWQPGSEPGYDPELPDGGHASMPALSAECDITVVDFALERVAKQHFKNESFIAFLDKPKEAWAKCRWINVNGLSWDVIQAVGTNKGLHKLALEDVMNLRNRTKADWSVSPCHGWSDGTIANVG
ncbi:hypothetical protein E5D57_000077 [Metarhizium anisopliae]|nr:hypothetical protein E5D57_000077 [Metarhizium anisopliae]